MGWGRIGPVLRVRADCAGRFFRRNYSRADDGGTIDRGTRCSCQKRDLGDPALALSDGCNGLRMRSLKPRPSPIVQPSHPSAVRDPASGANSAHPSPSARHFRLPFNKLAPSELRRIFCSDEGALVRVLLARRMTPRPVQHGGRVAVRCRRRICLRQQTTATRWRRPLPAGLLGPANARCNGAPLSELK